MCLAKKTPRENTRTIHPSETMTTKIDEFGVRLLSSIMLRSPYKSCRHGGCSPLANAHYRSNRPRFTTVCMIDSAPPSILLGRLTSSSMPRVTKLWEAGRSHSYEGGLPQVLRCCLLRRSRRRFFRASAQGFVANVRRARSSSCAVERTL